jgi:hypothetical protein
VEPGDERRGHDQQPGQLSPGGAKVKKQLTARFNAFLQQPVASVLSFVIATAWIMAAILAWVAIYRQINIVHAFPFIRPTNTGLELALSIAPLALLYWAPRR